MIARGNEDFEPSERTVHDRRPGGARAAAPDWTPLSLSTFFTDNSNAPYAQSPAGTDGTPRQNWFGAADGIFLRLWSLNFSVCARCPAGARQRALVVVHISIDTWKLFIPPIRLCSLSCPADRDRAF
jgi:hypothetical protein